MFRCLADDGLSYIIHVLSDTQPKGFEPVEGGLEDVYFATLSTLRRAA